MGDNLSSIPADNPFIRHIRGERRRPRRTEDPDRCRFHPDKPRIGCSDCLTDARVEGDLEAIARWHAAVQAGECDARFPPRFRTAQPSEPEIAAWVGEWEAREDPPGLLILGSVGVGKTHQAFGALRAAVTGARPVKWAAVSAGAMFDSLRPGDKRDPEKAMNSYLTVPLVLVDDLGAGKTSEWTEDVVFRVIDGRYAAELPVIVTSNGTPVELRERLGDRVVSRLAEMCRRVHLTGPDRRRQAAAEQRRAA
ncbi:ATP-binding protein [Salininema proteolyticum]|uniref:ATP-binding protein n=1 Tax=Salininema proteolyticum TaxID=1607685 RepID=A0ABV8TWL7_9ACTN